ncbi:MAG: HD domain-containing protein [Bacteroidia bacterium]
MGMDILQEIKEFAGKAHEGQRRKYSPDPYIVHPIRVMEICTGYTDELTVLAAALLHDVLEDTPLTAEELRNFLRPLMGDEKAEKTVRLVIELSDVYVKKDFPQFNRRKRKQLEAERMEKISPEAQLVKYADILDNSSEIAGDDPSFAGVYLRECRNLLKKMTKGDPGLRERTMRLIEEKLSSPGS